MTPPLLELNGVSKAFGALRPLRIGRLSLAEGEAVAVVGLDVAAAEVLVNLVMGATLPDVGEVRAFGRPTSSITDSAEWLTLADRFGVVSRRAVLLDSLSVLQNLAVPFSLDIDPLPDEVRDRAVELAREVSFPEAEWQAAVGSLDGTRRAQVHVARALALAPAVLLLEHPTVMVEPRERRRLGSLIRSVASRRGTAILALTSDEVFAGTVAPRVLHLDASTGRLVSGRGPGLWLTRRTR